MPSTHEGEDKYLTMKNLYNIKKKDGYEVVEGTPIQLIDGVDTFFSHNKTLHLWSITEATTGMLLVPVGFNGSRVFSPTKKDMIEKAKEFIQFMGEEKI